MQIICTSKYNDPRVPDRVVSTNVAPHVARWVADYMNSTNGKGEPERYIAVPDAPKKSKWKFWS